MFFEHVAASNLALLAQDVRPSSWKNFVLVVLAGDSIDFFVQVLGLSFHQAMREITAPQSSAQ